ncbi:neuropeptide FF receptor 2-like [Strongylocentrotus purpuratus]|uniref:G-protein coupled receptors family 1 profile domain-containing protein n=1 Tax=Strongylocentrotus purpuratus TaxID=7668 RepID=A0A7M7NI01_STRPU|nr:neuropeptide FF receptor 2-like [Strongylocentrotus purpuratus]
MTSTTTAIALPWVVLVSIMSFFALVGNIIVILVIIQDRYLKGHNYTFALVCNMAISDSLYVGLAVPLIIASAFTQGNWDLGNAGCKLMMFLPNFCIASSIYTMVFIAHDRRVTILINQPRVHQKSRIYLDPLLVWFLSLIMAAPAFYEYSVYQRPLFSLGDGLGGGSSSEEVRLMIVVFLGVVFILL